MFGADWLDWAEPDTNYDETVRKRKPLEFNWTVRYHVNFKEKYHYIVIKDGKRTLLDMSEKFKIIDKKEPEKIDEEEIEKIEINPDNMINGEYNLIIDDKASNYYLKNNKIIFKASIGYGATEPTEIGSISENGEIIIRSNYLDIHSRINNAIIESWDYVNNVIKENEEKMKTKVILDKIVISFEDRKYKFNYIDGGIKEDTQLYILPESRAISYINSGNVVAYLNIRESYLSAGGEPTKIVDIVEINISTNNIKFNTKIFEGKRIKRDSNSNLIITD